MLKRCVIHVLADVVLVEAHSPIRRERDIVLKDFDKKLAERASALMSGIDPASPGSVQLPPDERRHYRADRPEGFYFAVWSADGVLLDASRPTESPRSPDLAALSRSPETPPPALTEAVAAKSSEPKPPKHPKIEHAPQFVSEGGH